jgi:hypothetical protein
MTVVTRDELNQVKLQIRDLEVKTLSELLDIHDTLKSIMTQMKEAKERITHLEENDEHIHDYLMPPMSWEKNYPRNYP